MSPLSVTVIAPSRAIWGSERSILNLAPHLRARGVELTLATPPDGEFATAARALGMDVIALHAVDASTPSSTPRELLVSETKAAPANVRRIARAIRGADVVHGNSIVLHPAVAVAGRLRRRPVVLELHDIVSPGASSLVLSGAAALSAAVVSISAATEAPIRGPGRRRVVRVPQAVDLERFTPGPPVPDLRARVRGASTVVGIVGRVDPSKGIDRLVRAVSAAGPDVGLLVVGAPSIDAGGHLAEVRSLAADLLGERFAYLGPVADVPGVLRSLDVLVNASDSEPFGLTVLEAQACGTPVIGTAAGGIPDFVDDGRTGLLVPPRDVDTLAAAITRLAHDPDLRARLAGAALTEVRSRYGIEARADALAGIYRRVAR